MTRPLTPEKIMRYAWGYAPPLILEAAVRFRVFDALEDNPKTVAETSLATRASERGLSAVMNALVGLEFLARRCRTVCADAGERNVPG
jgi:hypothetical protein